MQNGEKPVLMNGAVRTTLRELAANPLMPVDTRTEKMINEIIEEAKAKL